MPSVLLSRHFELKLEHISDKARFLYYQLSDGCVFPNYNDDFLASRHNHLLCKVLMMLGEEDFLVEGTWAGAFDEPPAHVLSAWENAKPLSIVNVANKYAIEVEDGKEVLYQPSNRAWTSALGSVSASFPKSQGSFYIESIGEGKVNFGIRGEDYLDQVHGSSSFREAVEDVFKQLAQAPRSNSVPTTIEGDFCNFVRCMPDGGTGSVLKRRRDD